MRKLTAQFSSLYLDERWAMFNSRHNHCWNNDGTCYGAYGDGEGGKCSAIHEGIKKLGSKKFYNQ